MTLGCLVFIICCKGKTGSVQAQEPEVKVAQLKTKIAVIENAAGNTISSRFSPPKYFTRKSVDIESFASYLRNFPLLDPEEKVHLYNGRLKEIQSVHAAILDIDVGNRDLQQCADAVMRLRAEYLWTQQNYDEIAFNFTNGWRFEYSKWRQGNDLVVDGNKTTWKMGSAPKESYEDFRKYLNWVFMYAGTLSLSKELKPKKIENIEIGDVFIYGGSPGHAVLVVDLAVNSITGDKAFMIAQSYMPAQQIHVLKNEGNAESSPWYLLSEIGEELRTPEWVFEKRSLVEF